MFTLDGVRFDNSHCWSQLHRALMAPPSVSMRSEPAVVADQSRAAEPPKRHAEAEPRHEMNSVFISSRGNRSFSRQRDELLAAAEFSRGVFAETNLSANQIRDNIARLLGAFGLQRDAFTVFLREDRDAG
ncbi:hypothetical protein [uncultured Thiohalocapsa sp.]|uniref:hypothetical protein n=1 Tax=uncultured Thiohalocapsa sp. TaxID=768990 RepID=UPI0025D15AB2|nr:hypothetical protein [uncultured Thiohalocapsa sp.]